MTEAELKRQKAEEWQRGMFDGVTREPGAPITASDEELYHNMQHLYGMAWNGSRWIDTWRDNFIKKNGASAYYDTDREWYSDGEF
jgi:hypothetical protein